MLAEVETIIRTSPWSSYNEGMYANFKKINDQWGLKFYHSKSMRDKTYHFQMIAHEIGRAPRLGDKFDLKTPDGSNAYGYITECIDRLGYNIEEEYESLISDLEEIMETWDMHDENVGYLNGNLVAIDFSHCEEKTL
jgi:hypothetical protein